MSKIYIIKEHRSYQHYDEYDIIFISKSKEKADNYFSKLEKTVETINNDENIDYTIGYSFKEYDEEFNKYDL